MPSGEVGSSPGGLGAPVGLGRFCALRDMVPSIEIACAAGSLTEGGGSEYPPGMPRRGSFIEQDERVVTRLGLGDAGTHLGALGMQGATPRRLRHLAAESEPGE